MAFDKLMPGGSDSQVWFWIIAALDQDILHTGFADRVAQIYNLISDLLIAPACILLLEPDDEIYYHLRNLWSSGIPSALGSIIFLSNEFLIPSHNCVRSKQLCALLQHLSTEPFGLARYSHPLAVGQQDTFVPFFLMLNEDSHLFSQVINRFVQLLIDTISQTCDQ